MASLGSNIVLSWVNELADLEEQIEALQASKRDFYTAIRSEYGKPVANGLKVAMRIHRMDSEKRANAEKVDEETFRILSIIENGSFAPRVTRVENIEQFGSNSSLPPLPAETKAGTQPATSPAVPATNSSSVPSDGVADEVAVAEHVQFEGEGPEVASSPLSEARNKRCMRPASCKFAKHPHKLTCSDCSTAWQIAQRKREAA